MQIRPPLLWAYAKHAKGVGQGRGVGTYLCGFVSQLNNLGVKGQRKVLACAS